MPQAVRRVNMTTFLHKVARETRGAESTALTNESLVDMVLGVVAEVDWARSGRIRTVRGETLLATLTYCYAWGIYNSGEIEAAIVRNRQSWDLLNRMPLDRRSFAQYRRHNRDLITSCLAQVLERMNSNRVAEFEAERRIQHAVECDFLDSQD